jgi:hypothetical protein
MLVVVQSAVEAHEGTSHLGVGRCMLMFELLSDGYKLAKIVREERVLGDCFREKE